MMNNIKDTRSYPSQDVLLVMLRFALLEIRATNNIELANAMADIFHVLPSQLVNECDDEAVRNTYETILRKHFICFNKL